MEAVRRAFRPEFLNRLDDVLIFGRLGREEMARIVDIQLAAGQPAAGRSRALAGRRSTAARRAWPNSAGTPPSAPGR